MSRILIVEDEVLIGIMLEDMLVMLGHEIAGNAATLADAAALIERARFDLAVLDVNIGGEPVFALAERIAAQGAAIIFATGSGSEALPPALQHYAVLQKPYSFEAVAAAMGAAAAV